MTAEDGYRRYAQFLEKPPLLAIEWRDRETPAVGVLVVNSLTGGACGGGTRMRRFESAADGRPDVAKVREEAIFLSKTMEIKFGIAGPPIGGAKSVLAFDPADPRKRHVLRRWFAAIGPYLARRYGTGGDLNVDDLSEVVPLVFEATGLDHPQEGIVRGHFRAEGEEGRRRLTHLNDGLELPVELSDVPEAGLKLADLATGFGVSAAVEAFHRGSGLPLAGRRVLVEGFGAVGGPAAYYLHRAGARVVGILCRERDDFLWAVDPEGLDVPALLAGRQPGGLLPADCPRGATADAFWSGGADIFVPAARSQSIDEATLDRLAAAGVSLIACGANNPFADPPGADLAVARRADRTFAILPDFVANCGMARVFAYLMDEGARLEPEAVFADVRRTMDATVARLLQPEPVSTGLLGRALDAFVPQHG